METTGPHQWLLGDHLTTGSQYGRFAWKGGSAQVLVQITQLSLDWKQKNNQPRWQHIFSPWTGLGVCELMNGMNTSEHCMSHPIKENSSK